MKILHLLAGAGGMYCGGCLHGNTLAAALREAGEDVILAPLYTPIRTDEDDVSIDRVALGGANVYLQQRWAVFRHLPAFVNRLLDHAKLLDRLAKLAPATRPEKLGALTVSMLQGEQGHQRKELQKLIHWLRQEIQPEVIHLSNVLLAGLAGPLSRELNVPVVCTLAGEDAFLEKLPPPYDRQAMDELRRRIDDVAGLVAMNAYYAELMAERLEVARDKIHVIPPGLNLAGHATQPPRRTDRKQVTVGYLARVCHDKGLHVLVEALIRLAADKDLPPVHLHVAGYLDRADRPYLQEIQSRLMKAGLDDRFHYAGELDRVEKIAFLQSLDVFSVPTVHPESKGLFALEAWANGIPTVLPDHGAFPEMVGDTGGGLLCRPDDPGDLAAKLKELVQSPETARDCGHKAQQAVHSRYNADLMAQRTIELYRRVLGRG